MAKYTGPKDRLSRREGTDLFGKGLKLTRLTVPPGIHGPKGTGRRPSQFGRQLREKQKVKRMYGVLEKQFKKYVDVALKSRENSGGALFSQLERRLDNVVYRLGFANTRQHARQIVGHRHVLVNGKKLNIPSYQVKEGDTVSLTAKIMATPPVAKLLEQKDYECPEWLLRKAAVGKVKRLPTLDDISELVSAPDIIEFYSR